MALRASTLSASIAVCVLSLPVRAAPPTPPGDSNAAAAETRFREASEAFDQGRIDEACTGFAESAHLYPTLGTLLNLALCHEREGKMATAWLEFTHAAAWADDASQGDRREFARQHAARLERTLSRIQVELPMDAAPMVLAVDGEPLVGARASLPLFLDPGAHTLSVSAPSRKTYTTLVTVSEAPSVSAVVVHVPMLTPASAIDAPATPSPGPVPSFATSSRRRTGWIVGGAGVLLVGIGASLGVDTLVKVGQCGAKCDTTSAEVAEALSLVSFGTGLAALGVGGWLLHSPTAVKSSAIRMSLTPQVAPAGGGITLAGFFD
jgi:hypothetical protein